MFDSTKESLQSLLQQAHANKIQLPDFQRSWVWDDEAIRSLLASILRGFPVGAILTLSVGGEVRFLARPLETVPTLGVQPEQFLLDGQQRLTSLYQALYSSQPVKTRNVRGQAIERYYFLDIRRALERKSDFEAAIIGLPKDRIERGEFGKGEERNLSTPELQFENHMFPMNQVFKAFEWFYGWANFWNARGESVQALQQPFNERIVQAVAQYNMPIIRLAKENSREAICLVFEKVNTGGKKLDAFELLTAIYAADEFNLRTDWFGDSERPGRAKRMLGLQNRQDVLRNLQSTDFLQACTLLHTMSEREKAKSTAAVEAHALPPVSVKREAMLALPLHAYRTHADPIERGFEEAALFLNEEKIIWHRDVPYPPQLIAMAGLIARMGLKAQTAASKARLREWFWCGVLGERYGVNTETRIARDVPELIDWIEGTGPTPHTLQEALFQIDRLDTLRSRLASAYKGIHALLMREGCRDFISGKPVDIMTFFQASMDIHHIFPRAWCEKNGIKPERYNSIINKTALSAASNRRIGGNAPSIYLRRIEQDGIAPDALDDILRSHLIDPNHIRADDFEAFWQARRRALADLVARAMNKPVVEQAVETEPMGPPDDTGEAEDEEAAA